MPTVTHNHICMLRLKLVTLRISFVGTRMDILFDIRCQDVPQPSFLFVRVRKLEFVDQNIGMSIRIIL